jgi:hypothetical protein
MYVGFFLAIGFQFVPPPPPTKEKEKETFVPLDPLIVFYIVPL